MLTGLTANTFTKIQLNAGIFLKNFSYSSATDSTSLKTAIATAISAGTSLLGATKGGGTFEMKPEIREIEADGKRAPFKGSEINDGWTVKLTTTLIEVTPENFQAALITGTLATSGNVKTLTFRDDIATTDYLEHLCWVGDLADGRCVLIELDNALNTAGATFTFTDKGEGELPVEFTAHQSSVASTGYAPCRIVFFDTASST